MTLLEIIFSLLTGQVSFQIFLVVGHFKYLTRHNLFINNALKKMCW